MRSKMADNLHFNCRSRTTPKSSGNEVYRKVQIFETSLQVDLWVNNMVMSSINHRIYRTIGSMDVYPQKRQYSGRWGGQSRLSCLNVPSLVAIMAMWVNFKQCKIFLTYKSAAVKWALDLRVDDSWSRWEPWWTPRIHPNPRLEIDCSYVWHVPVHLQ